MLVLDDPLSAVDARTERAILDVIDPSTTEVIARVRADGRLRIVGITGSNGKTTTKNLLRSVLSACTCVRIDVAAS